MTRARPSDTRAFGTCYDYERDERGLLVKGEPVTDDAKRWAGWGTALKPAHEPIALARKPFRGTVTANVLAHGTGALNIDACRVGDVGGHKFAGRTGAGAAVTCYGGGLNDKKTTLLPGLGRWPANVLTDGSLEVLEALPASARDAIRFFYSPKADRAEREFGMDGAAEVAGEVIKRRKADSACTQSPHSGLTNTPLANVHPTVKPIDLMAWLCRLVTPPGGLVLDPFMGSGSTGIAAVRHGFRFVGIEQSPEYFEIACRRIAAAVEADDKMPRLDREITKFVRAQQLSMFEA